MGDIENEMEGSNDHTLKRNEDRNDSAQKTKIYGDTEQKTIQRHSKNTNIHAISQETKRVQDGHPM